MSQADHFPHPFFASSYRTAVKESMGKVIPRSTTVDNVVYDPRLTEPPVEERKRQQAMAAGKPYRVPEWWRGERTNYKIASSMMKTLPKKIGPLK